MKMGDKVFVRDNNWAGCSCAKLYLDSKTADVSFKFAVDTDHPEVIVAHKNLLSAGSPVFDTMFYGSLIEAGDVPIVDASPAAFKEFLQFFYMSQVRLTAENIGEVINLCNKYELPECVKVCEIPLQKSLTSHDMCWGYEIAILLGLENLQEFCEQKIKQNAPEILTSESFLECGRKTVAQILQMVKSRCGALIVVEACLEWAKAENERNDLDVATGNLKAQLGDLFDRIPFSEMSMEQFFNHICKYQGLFTDNEIGAIVQMIATKKFQSTCLHDPLTFTNLECDRHGPGDVTNFDYRYGCCVFYSSKAIFLKEFYLPQLQSKPTGVKNMEIIYKFLGPCTHISMELAIFGKTTLTSEKETRIVLPEPVWINAGQAYCITLIPADLNFTIPDMDDTDEFSFIQQSPLEIDVKLDDGTKIKFLPANTLVSRFIFQKPRNPF